VSADQVLSVLDASKTYRMGDTTVHALRNASLTIKAGELIGIFGPSGSGKTTLLMIAGLLDTPSSGTVVFKGRAVSAPGAELNYLRDFRRRHIGFVFQKPNLIPFLAAIGNVQIAMQINDEEKTVAAKRARFLLEQFGIGARADNLPIELSGGEQQRVAIARALANRPELILADEPTANLDSSRGRQVMEMFRRLADYEGVSICVVTHDLRSEDLFDRRIEICDGRVVVKQ
jgi:putative ABC transport system ATP-binding protein